ncbi:glycoside hydrolase family 3 C-terminal domain-containing protein [Vibrio sp. J1-1]|uniref:glycoside hydrolase family 3 protein n=1 Tax=Vibrio sp. J1-1 TaxID=2912251 RepID=UPI001F02C813|nr:glycoside hydrolase family 3 protein [Vibrio sp. J1-1]MCF7483018.1 glycoside hydrolase family 3 C-terminal domain-containing protein [Vibrio sp. J1-1]
MKKIYTLSAIASAVALTLTGCWSDSSTESVHTQATLGYISTALINEDGYQFKDLNRDNQLTPYEDWRLDSATRAKDLLSRMTLEQKVGIMMHGTLSLDAEGRVDFNSMSKVLDNYVNTFITRMSGNPQAIAEDNNSLQQIAESTGLGIPVTISTDPRNHFTNDPGATAVSAGEFSQWPELLGFAALNDAETVKEFADIARQEYRAVGIQMALSPQADLATEPRWGRVSGTFGEDNNVAKNLVGAYIEGFQNGGNGLNNGSVITVVKHFAGGGPQLDGFDAHNQWGKEQIYPGSNFEYHLVPFEGAFDANVASVMPYYGQPIGLTYEGESIEEVGFGFNKQIITDLLRGTYNFKGVVLSDWGIVKDCGDRCINGLSDEEVANGVSPWSVPFGMSWGVEDLTIPQRYAKAIDAGVDQFGGVDDPSYLLTAVNSGLVTEEQINASVNRILIQKFDLGLFEDPYVDVDEALELVGNDEFQQLGQQVQSSSHVLLKNEADLLPLSAETYPKVYLYQSNAAVAQEYGFEVVDTPAEADIAIVRVNTPYESDPHYPFGSVHYGQLGFANEASLVQDTDHLGGSYTGSEDLTAIQAVTDAGIPMVLSVYLDRPAILTEVAHNADAIMANFGALDNAMFDVLTGVAEPKGHLPFELPSSWSAVLEQDEDVPYDSIDPLYEYGFGLSYQQ